jgi:hypothetical protein
MEPPVQVSMMTNGPASKKRRMVLIIDSEDHEAWKEVCETFHIALDMYRRDWRARQKYQKRLIEEVIIA